MRLLFVVTLSLFTACAPRRPLGPFRVLPADPNYLLRAPDSQVTPFPEVLSRFTRTSPNWVDLRPWMELRIENAYFREGAPKRDLANYLGTEVAHVQVRPNRGVRLLSVQSGLTQHPAGQPPVQQLIRSSSTRYQHYRFSYEIVFNRKSGLRGAVLLGAASTDELDRLAAQLFVDPGSVCDGSSPHCTLFPEACTVSLEIEITVNGEPRTVLWGSYLGGVAARPRHLELLRLYAGRLTPVEIDPGDPNALRLPLLPGDRITWD